MFSNSFHAKGTNIELPIPHGFYELKIKYENEKQRGTQYDLQKNTIFDFPLSEGVNQIDAEFLLDAPNGTADWKPDTLSTLSGITLIMMSEANGVHFKDLPEDFNSRLNSSSRELLRFGNSQSPFPKFEVNGILPKRNSLYLLMFLFSCLLLATPLLFLLKRKK